MAYSSEIDRIYSGEYPQAIQTLSNTIDGDLVTFVSPIIDDLSIDAGAQYGNPFSDYGDKLMQFSQKFSAGVGAATEGLTGYKADLNAVAEFKTLVQTMSLWQGSDIPTLSCNMTFITTNSREDRGEQAIQLASHVYPVLSTDKKGKETSRISRNPYAGAPFSASQTYSKAMSDRLTSQLTPPAGYKLVGGVPTGTWTLTKGTYFCAPGLVITNASLTQSKIRLRNGEAQVSTVNCSLKPALDITRDEFLNWFSISKGK